jgi:hypothetical protein
MSIRLQTKDSHIKKSKLRAQRAAALDFLVTYLKGEEFLFSPFFEFFLEALRK